MAHVRLDPECIRCLLGKHLNAAPETASQQERIVFMQRLLSMIAQAPVTEGAPVLVSRIEQLEKEMFGITKDYAEEKRMFNDLMLGMEKEIWQRIEQSANPLYTAVQFAMIGNFIDFGAMDHVDEVKLMELLENSAQFVPQESAFDAFSKDVMSAKKLVYLTDNCGEIVMDKLLLHQIHTMNPGAELTVIVRGEPVLNDATVEDALSVGIDELARVIGNGSGIAGTSLRAISQEALEEIDNADMLIAKGQANFETLRRCGRNVYYIFLCKCELFARRFSVPRFQGMLLRDAES